MSIRDGKVSVDGRKLDEPYTHGLDTVLDSCPTTYVPGIDTKEGFKVPEDHVLVLGDNRVNSRDGRCFGPIDEDLIVGRAFFLMWPPSRAGGLWTLVGNDRSATAHHVCNGRSILSPGTASQSGAVADDGQFAEFVGDDCRWQGE